MPHAGRSERQAVAGLLLIGLLLRVGFALASFGGEYDPYARLKGDTANYLAIGMSLGNGEGYSHHYRSVLPEVFRGAPVAAPPATPTANRSPGYPFFLAAVFSTFGHDLRVLVILQAILSSLTPLFIYLTARELRTLPKLALGFAVFYYPFAFDPLYLMSEWLFTLVTAATLWLLVRPGSELLGGLLAGVCVLVKSVTLPFLLLVSLVPRRRRLVFLLGMLGVLGPWGYRNYVHTGVPHVTPAQGGYALFLVHNPANWGLAVWSRPGDQKEDYPGFAAAVKATRRGAPRVDDPVAQEFVEDRALLGEALKFVRAEPGQALRAVWGSVLNTWRLDYPGANWLRWTSSLVLYVCLVPFALWGGVRSLRSGPPGARLLVFFLVYFVGIHALLPSEIRYRVAAMPAFFVLAAYGVSGMGGATGQRGDYGRGIVLKSISRTPAPSTAKGFWVAKSRSQLTLPCDTSSPLAHTLTLGACAAGRG